ncbi:MAG: bifunctional phosphoglucose/phosphomannose isomerase [Anaerolineae bacterium]|nr:bifunctional phosphoglucose/phosphomannose isomerase [Anaerolineae bacterium]
MNTDRLDDVQEIRALDPSNMLQHVGALARQVRDARALTQGLVLSERHRAARQVVVVGMGGSAIGGDLAAAAVRGSGQVPVIVVRDYSLPAWVDEATMVVGSSYSGNTEETLSAFREAYERGCPLVAVTTNGELARLADRWAVPLVRFGYPSQPRAALGYLFVAMLGVLQAAGLAPDLAAGVEEGLSLIEEQAVALAPGVPRGENRAKQLAVELAGRVPVVVGAGPLAPVAGRWKTQINENSKGWAYAEVLPEMNHNALSGTHFPPQAAEMLRVLFLQASGLHPRTALRLELTRQIMEARGVRCLAVPVRGESPVAQILSAVHLGDYVSTYLAILYGEDPTTIGDIVGLKERMTGQ